MLQPTVRRTWSPEGHTPIHHSWDRRDRLSAISAVTVSPKRRRLGLCFEILDRNVRTDAFESFIADVLGQLNRPIIVVIDRLAAHRSAAKRLRARFAKRIDIEWLPPYAPELNPDEQVWRHSKYVDLANFIPEDVDHLHEAMVESFEGIGNSQTLLRSFFKHTKLPL